MFFLSLNRLLVPTIISTGLCFIVRIALYALAVIPTKSVTFHLRQYKNQNRYSSNLFRSQKNQTNISLWAITVLQIDFQLFNFIYRHGKAPSLFHRCTSNFNYIQTPIFYQQFSPFLFHYIIISAPRKCFTFPRWRAFVKYPRRRKKSHFHASIKWLFITFFMRLSHC